MLRIAPLFRELIKLVLMAFHIVYTIAAFVDLVKWWSFINLKCLIKIDSFFFENFILLDFTFP